ncbi:Hypothetical protein NCS54_00335200 [Fusarium falciforme]|uniref:Uncharacterized protein n=1 Tax=Fusarium falciforme TaxID=195108 RepID=A0A9W8USE6_9HYPO|nr:Hypothetical protein NCS54_00335200 [Fusarium falciforme]KAJ4177237.1 hypothetical protein NW755_013960 [Fusarium falciforme]WAO86094.1 Hypothetical protein NCS54_00335200 [Fusarium falciforme]
MKVLIPLSFLIAGVFAQDGCGFPDGPDCVSLGEGANGLEQFADDGCCLLPIRCGNGDGGERCERVAVAGNNNNNNADNNNNNAGNGNNDNNAGNNNAGNNNDAGNNNNNNAGNGNAGNAGNNNNGNNNAGNDNAGNAGNAADDENCGFPNGPDCESLGEGANGLEQFADDGCCLLPFRCGNGDGGERCERVPVASNKVRSLHALRTRNRESKKHLRARDGKRRMHLRPRFHGPRDS